MSSFEELPETESEKVEADPFMQPTDSMHDELAVDADETANDATALFCEQTKVVFFRSTGTVPKLSDETGC